MLLMDVIVFKPDVESKPSKNNTCGVCDNQPFVGKWETLTGEGGFGACGGLVVFAMIGAGERDRVVRRIVMSCFVMWKKK